MGTLSEKIISEIDQILCEYPRKSYKGMTFGQTPKICVTRISISPVKGSFKIWTRVRAHINICYYSILLELAKQSDDFDLNNTNQKNDTKIHDNRVALMKEFELEIKEIIENNNDTK